MTIEIQPIAYVSSPYKEKFAIPRQPGLVKSAKGKLCFTPQYQDPDYIRGIEQFSHLWLIFQFHATADKSAKALVRPPRLGGNKKIGVFATRSTFRPNNLGLSVVTLDSVDNDGGLNISAMDLLDNTPIIDIKPYLPYADNRLEAEAGYAVNAPQANMPVIFSQTAQQLLVQLQNRYPHLRKLIEEVLAQDPRPAYQQHTQSERIYGMTLYEFNINWQVEGQTNIVIAIESVNPLT